MIKELTIGKILVLLSTVLAAMAIVVLPAFAETSSNNSSLFFCQNATTSTIVDPNSVSTYITQGYQCSAITHNEPFVCVKNNDPETEVTVFGGKQLSTYISLGFTCKHN